MVIRVHFFAWTIFVVLLLSQVFVNIFQSSRHQFIGLSMENFLVFHSLLIDKSLCTLIRTQGKHLCTIGIYWIFLPLILSCKITEHWISHRFIFANGNSSDWSWCHHLLWRYLWALPSCFVVLFLSIGILLRWVRGSHISVVLVIFSHIECNIFLCLIS